MKDIDNYEMLLKSQERSESTIIKYIYEAKCFLNYLGEKKLTKDCKDSENSESDLSGR